MSERPFPEHTIQKDSSLSLSFSASGLVYLWGLYWSESSLLTLGSSFLFSLSIGIMRTGSSGAIHNGIFSIHWCAVPVLHLHRLNKWNQNEQWATQALLCLVWKTLGVASCSLPYSLETRTQSLQFFIPKWAYVHQAPNPPVSAPPKLGLQLCMAILAFLHEFLGYEHRYSCFCSKISSLNHLPSV